MSSQESAKRSMENNVIVQTPLTYSTSWANSYYGTRCEVFEKNWLECASKLGLTRAEKECKLERQDLNECSSMDLSYKRYMRLQEERQKKGLPYQDPPPYDTLANMKFKNVVFQTLSRYFFHHHFMSNISFILHFQLSMLLNDFIQNIY